MEILVTTDYAGLSRAAADVVNELAQQQPEALVILPSGETPRGTYKLLVAAHKAGIIDLSRLTVMALDEWGGRSRSHPLSCHQMIATSFVEPVGIPPERFHSLDGTAADPQAECRRYDKLLTSLGRPALSLLGLGTNGHIALNEPAPNLPIQSHVVPLAPATLARTAQELADQPVADQPLVTNGLTLGMAQIMSANKILLLASGQHKETAVRAMLTGPIGTECPASLLLLHPQAQLILDEMAAGTTGST